MIINCNDGTVDLSTHKMIGDDRQLSEFTERIEDVCGSTLIEEEFIKFLRERLGTRAIDKLKENHYGQLKYMIQQFCELVKKSFTGDDTNSSYEIEVEGEVLQYVNEETRKILEDDDFVIVIKYDNIKKMFDTFINRIIRLIHIQISNNYENCLALFLVRQFTNKYLFKRIKQEFNHRFKYISVPTLSMAAIARGAVIFGQSSIFTSHKMNDFKFLIFTQVLKHTYGVKISMDWEEGVDPSNRKTPDGKAYKFFPLVKRGTQVNKEQRFSFNFIPESSQTHNKFEVYYTRKYDAIYTDEPEMELLRVINIDLSGNKLHYKIFSLTLNNTNCYFFEFIDVHVYNRSVNFGLSFGQMEITVFAKVEPIGQKYSVTFCPNIDEL